MRAIELSEIREDEDIQWRWLRDEEYAEVRWWPLASGDPDSQCEVCSSDAVRIADLGWAGYFIYCGEHSPGAGEVVSLPSDSGAS